MKFIFLILQELTKYKLTLLTRFFSQNQTDWYWKYILVELLVILQVFKDFFHFVLEFKIYEKNVVVAVVKVIKQFNRYMPFVIHVLISVSYRLWPKGLNNGWTRSSWIRSRVGYCKRNNIKRMLDNLLCLLSVGSFGEK